LRWEEEEEEEEEEGFQPQNFPLFLVVTRTLSR
jgi:hypothetical protein